MLIFVGPIVVPIIASLAFIWNATGGRRTDGGVLTSLIAVGLSIVYLVMLVQHDAGRREWHLYAAAIFSIAAGAGSVLVWRRHR